MFFIIVAVVLVAGLCVGAVLIQRVVQEDRMPALAGNGVKVTTVSQKGAGTSTRLESGGISYIFPPERSPNEVKTSTSSDGKFSYESPTLIVRIVDKNLEVDGKVYGKFAQGDEVDFRKQGKVLVNGVERDPVSY